MAAHPDFTGEKSTVPGFISWTLAVAVVYTIATGSIFFGWLATKFIGNGLDGEQGPQGHHVHLCAVASCPSSSPP